MISTSLSMMAVGFTLGLMHALDADHVMAVSALTNQHGKGKPGVWRILGYCANWAFGHAGVLLTSGALLFGLGWHLPEALQQAAEMSVGVLLIGLGLYCFWQFRQQKLVIEQHSHGNVTHTHWHLEGDVKQAGHQGLSGQSGKAGKANKAVKKEGHAPVMVGVVHGLAGSAPALALVPAVSQGQMLLALTYLLIFSLGVMLSMLVFGLSLGSIQTYLQQKHLRFFEWQRHSIAGASILFGGYWLTQALAV